MPGVPRGAPAGEQRVTVEQDLSLFDGFLLIGKDFFFQKL
jgi:hypothetical protein